MKKLCLYLLTIIVSAGSCQTREDVTRSYIKITPIGSSDSPRTLLYISIINIDSIANFDPNENVGFIDKILTNAKTLRAIMAFVASYNYNRRQKWDATEFEANNISVYDKRQLHSSHDLNLSESRKFLNALVEMLDKSGLDQKIGAKIDQDVLQPIEY